MADTIDNNAVSPVQASSEDIQKINANLAKPGKTVHDWFREPRMSADVNKTTVGVDTDHVTPELLLATSSKLLKINRREAEPDAKDSLQFQRIYGPADFIAEHVLRDADRLGRQLLWKATNRGNVDFMPTAALDQHVSDVFNSSKLANMIDGSSPLETIEASYKVTRIGEGGVSSIDSAPVEMRLVQPSFLGFLDGVATPESLRVGLDGVFTKHCMKGSDGKLYQKFINARTGKEELVDSVTAAKSVVTTPDMMAAKTNHIYAVGGRTGVRIVNKKDVDYYLPRMDDAFSNASNLVTGLSGVKELRLRMGCLHPLTNVLVVNKRNEVSILPAKNVNTACGAVPVVSDDGNTTYQKIQTTVAKFPLNRAWFKKVVLYSGRTLITSRDHRWSIIRKDGTVALVNAEKLKQGDKVMRTVFKDVPSRRTFINGVLVNKDVAILLGYVVRTLANPDDDKLTVTYQPRHAEAVKRAIAKIGAAVKFYTTAHKLCLSMTDGWFHSWVKDKVGVQREERNVPSEILSATMSSVACFLDAYTADETQVAEDELEYIWILNIPNTKVRDGLAFLLARTGTDTFYRDAYLGNGEHQLALKLLDMNVTRGDVVVDEVKAVLPVPNAAVMIDIDVDDQLYATANGIVTHNSKYPQQAVSIEGREAPLVRGLDEQSGKDMQSTIGRYLGARYTSKPGTVSAVRKDRIDMLYDDGTKGSIALYHNYPMNAKGFITNEPVVKAGMHLDKNALVASSNYTDKDGVAALGTNLRIGWISWHGGTYEDAIVVSESAAKKLTSTTMYSKDLDLDKTITLGKSNYLSWKPGEFNKEQLALLDDEGVVKPGSVLRKGDPVVLAVRTTEPSPGTMGKRVLTDMTETWDHDHPGLVTDIVRTRSGVKVLATVTAPCEVGDKLANCYGNKGVISKVLPDDEMPKDADGKPLDIIMSPLGLVSRTNSTQLDEAMLGKVAHKTGKPITIPAFYNGDRHRYVLDQLRQNRLQPDNDFFDPDTGRKIPNVINGYAYIYKLKHMAESKESGRGTGEYTMDDTAGGSGYEGSKRLGGLETSALVGHGAFDTLLDAHLIRGQSNADFWRSIRTGGIPTIPGEPLVQKKFFAHLQGAGVNVRKTPKGISVFALSNADVDELSGPRELKSKATYEAKNFRPIDGGLFGQDVFGMNGDKWGYIQLDEPLPNPVMAEPLAKLLRMSDRDFTAVASGSKTVDGMSNGTQMKERLEKIDLEQASKEALQEFKNAPASKKDAAMKRYVAIERMNRQGVKASEYMLDRIPVIPPIYRPVSSSNGLTMVADANYLYAQLLDARDDLRDARDLPAEYQDKARANLYTKWQELTGLYDPEDVKLRNKNVGGLLQWALGKGSPKFSAVQRKVIGTSVDTVGRGAVIPDARLTIDEVGIPVSMAFGIMAPFVTRALVKRGYSTVDAMKMVKSHDKQAMDALEEIVATHPVEMNRAPSLHKFNILAFKPKLVQGHAIHVHPSICPGYAMDFDGDQQIGRVKLRISTDFLLDEKILEKIESSELQKIITILYYVAGKKGLTFNHIGDMEMAFRELRTQLSVRSTSDDQYVVLDTDLADIPHGRLLAKSAGSRGNTDFYEALPGMQVLAYDENTGKIVWADISGWSEHHGCQVEIVHLDNGMDIITDDDPRAVYGIAKDADSLVPQRFTPEAALKAKVCVPCVKPGTALVHEEDVFHYVREADGSALRGKSQARCYELTFEFGQTLGLLTGDGWWDKIDRPYVEKFGGPRGVYMSDNEGTNANYVAEYLQSAIAGGIRLFSHKFDKDQYADRYGDTVKYSIFGEVVGFNDMLTQLLGGCSDEATAGSGNKHLPVWTQATPYEFRRGLLCGLVSTDGSISISRAKNKDQLMIGFCSTSLRLCRELMDLCRSLGIRTSLTFSKTTLRGNSAWQVTISAFDAKRLGTFNDMANTRKADIFKSTAVNEDVKYSHGDYRVFPKCVSDTVLKWLRAPKVKSAVTTGMSEEEIASCRWVLSLYTTVAKYIKRGYTTFGVVCQLKEYAEKENKRIQWALDEVRTAIGMLEADVNCPLTEAWKHTMWRALNTLQPQLDHKLFKDARCILSRRATYYGKGCQGLLDALRKVAEADVKSEYGLSEEPVFREWLDMCINGDCSWTFIDNVEKTGKVETGYDLTVPGYETFMSTSGVVLSNTVNIHVPVSDNARREAMDKMRPSRNLLTLANHKIMNKPEKEYMQGLYIATRMGKAKDGRAQIFRTFEEAREAYRNGLIDVDTPINIIGGVKGK